MGTAAISNNLTQVNPSEGKRDTVGYKYHPTDEEKARNANYDTYEMIDIVDKVKNQIKDRIANLDVPNILDVKGKSITDAQNNLRFSERTVVGRDGSTFQIGYYSNSKTGEKYRSGYLDILAEKATGINNSSYVEYFSNITSNIVSVFGTAATYKEDMGTVQRAIFSAIDEMKENIANGKENPIENLKTAVTIGGVEWNFKDILNISALMINSFDGIDRTITMDYIEYAKMGLSIGNVQNFADKNLNKEQSDMVKSILKSRADYYDRRIDEEAERSRDKWIHAVSSEQRKKYYKYGYYVSATNEELRNSIKDIFASVGKSSDLAEALSRYNQLMPPALKASGISESSFAQVLKNDAKTLSSYYSALFLLQK